MTSAIMSGYLYDMLKHGTSITVDSVKEKLKGWLLDDSVAPDLTNELSVLNLSNELSELAIEKRINQAPRLLELLSSIKKEERVTTIIQKHSGTGDNVGRDKIIM